MPRACTVCIHPDREGIDAALVGGGTLPAIGAEYSVSPYALGRHKRNHLPATLTQAQEAREVAHGDDLLGQLDGLSMDAHRIKDRAEQAGDFRAALTGIRELVRIVELLAKMRGELQEAQVNILIMPEWVTIRAALIDALAPYPEARAAAARALQGLGGG